MRDVTLNIRKRWPEFGLLLLGGALLSAWAWNAVGSLRFQATESRKFESARVEAAAPGAHPAFAAPESPGESLGQLEIPRLGIGGVFAEGVDARTLRHAIGHVPGSALPGAPGNCALAGHRDTFLHGLGEIRAGDVIRIRTHDRDLSYRVEWAEVVDAQFVQVLSPTASRSLTLVTCYPFRFVGDAPDRYVVRARQLD